MQLSNKAVINPKQLQGAFFAAFVVVFVLLSSRVFSMTEVAGATSSPKRDGSFLLKYKESSPKTNFKKFKANSSVNCSCRICCKYKYQSVADLLSGSTGETQTHASFAGATSFQSFANAWSRPQYYVFLYNYSLF